MTNEISKSISLKYVEKSVNRSLHLKKYRNCYLLRLEGIFIKLSFYHTLITVPSRGTTVIRNQLTS